MKKSLLITMLAVTAVFASCSKSSDDSSPKSMDFAATAGAFTSGPKVNWAASDQIGLFSNETLYALTAKAAGSSTTFSGTLTKGAQYYAISPYSAKSTVSGGLISATVPAEQTAVKDGVLASAVVAVASSTNTTLAFKNATALLKLSLVSDNNIKSIKIASKGTDNLAGDINVNAADAKVTVVKGSTEINFTAGSANIEKGTYYVSVLPGSYADGLNITLTDEYGRVATVASEEFLTAKASQVVDLGEIDKSIVFATPALTSTPTDLSIDGDGETVKTTLSASFKTISVIKVPSWTTVNVKGAEVTATAAASTLDKDARYGKIHVEGITDNGPATADIYVAQGAKGCRMVFDSFSGKNLDSNWKGNTARANVKLEDGCLKISGSGEINSATTTYPLFRMDKKARQKYDDNGSTNQFSCTVDIKADGATGGIYAFNAFGYTDAGTYDFMSKQNYAIFMNANQNAAPGAHSGSYYCYNIASANAMDDWDCPTGSKVTEWVRLEVTNIDRGNDGTNGDWGVRAIWSLEEDENGVLQKKDLLFHGGMWWWNDSPQLGTQYGYFGVFGKDTTEVSMRNFSLTFQDNK